MEKETLQKIGTGEAHAIVAEAWFTFLGFLAATAVLHAAEQKSGQLPLTVLKWISYLLLFRWINFKIDQLIWAHFSAAKPENSRALKLWQVGLSTGVAAMMTMGSYILVLSVIQALIEVNAV